jgi:hypothetical protein
MWELPKKGFTIPGVMPKQNRRTRENETFCRQRVETIPPPKGNIS